MKALKCLLIPCLWIGLLSGCLPSMSRAPVGMKPMKTPDAEWSGLWLSGDADPLQIKVLDESKGQLLIGWFEPSSPNLEVIKRQLLIRHVGAVSLFNMTGNGEEGEKATEFMFGRLVKNDRSIVAWAVKPEALRKLSELSLIKAEFETNNLSLTARVTEGHEVLSRKLAEPEGWLLLDLENPLVLVRQK